MCVNKNRMILVQNNKTFVDFVFREKVLKYIHHVTGFY